MLKLCVVEELHRRSRDAVLKPQEIQEGVCGGGEVKATLDVEEVGDCAVNFPGALQIASLVGVIEIDEDSSLFGVGGTADVG